MWPRPLQGSQDRGNGRHHEGIYSNRDIFIFCRFLRILSSCLQELPEPTHPAWQKTCEQGPSSHTASYASPSPFWVFNVSSLFPSFHYFSLFSFPVLHAPLLVFSLFSPFTLIYSPSFLTLLPLICKIELIVHDLLEFLRR